ncbi:hypothetical protein B0J13DRAFT_638861 [Dactylonectria estremocensis]|uniref:Uncharacterized protein n=1 Tax=Dactylonectria estremocensis TaxID=1079267 RepID=A0A9P9IXY1_9HYPO|nr:hypothetical protein B0J13DRAFT_638861 [Dactylonectria estremocensis]
MATPVPVPADAIKATYNGIGGFLELKAKGELPSWILPPFFQREPFVGGLLFSLSAFRAGYGKPTQKPFETTYKLDIILPQNHFNSASVLVETSLGTFAIPIKYIDIPGPGLVIPTGQKTSNGSNADEELKPYVVLGDVLPPIAKYLPGDTDLTITAQIPKTVGDAKSWINPSFNAEYFKLVNATITGGAINWTFKWNKIPTGQGENLQALNITTSIWNGELGPSAKNSRIVQPYIVHFVLLQN